MLKVVSYNFLLYAFQRCLMFHAIWGMQCSTGDLSECKDYSIKSSEHLTQCGCDKWGAGRRCSYFSTVIWHSGFGAAINSSGSESSFEKDCQCSYMPPTSFNKSLHLHSVLKTVTTRWWLNSKHTYVEPRALGWMGPACQHSSKAQTARIWVHLPIYFYPSFLFKRSQPANIVHSKWKYWVWAWNNIYTFI